MRAPSPPITQVASFYSMFNRTKIGKFHVMICGTTPCRCVSCVVVGGAQVWDGDADRPVRHILHIQQAERCRESVSVLAIFTHAKLDWVSRTHRLNGVEKIEAALTSQLLHTHTQAERRREDGGCADLPPVVHTHAG